MAKLPLVSIIIPVYNRLELFKKTLKEIPKQTLKDYEILVVDNGSKEDIKGFVEGERRKDKRIRYLSSGSNNGPAVPRNFGIKNSKGKYICFLDSDDIWDNDHLRRCLEFMDSDNLDLVFSDYADFESETGKVVTEDLHADFKRYIPGKTVEGGKVFDMSILKYIVKRHFMLPGTIMLRRSKAIYFDESFFMADDHDFALRLIHSGVKAGYIPETHLYRRIHEGNLSFNLDFRRGEIQEKEEIRVYRNILRWGYPSRKTANRNLAKAYFDYGYLLRKKDKMKSFRCYTRSLNLKFSSKALAAILKLLFN